MKWYSGFFKRVFDITGSLLIIVLTTPIYLLLVIMGWCSLGLPVFFRQTRPGKGGALFELIKIRTMSSGKDEAGQLLPDAQRLTRYGRFLRASSLDELPELFNVLRGDMSLVGPRPLLVQYLDRYTPEQARRHEVRPGITGWAQVNGRNDISWEKKFELDVWYVDHLSFWLDVKILGLTIFKVVKREGISQDGQATMEEFKGLG